MVDPMVGGVVDLMVRAVWWSVLCGVLIGWGFVSPLCGWLADSYWDWRDRRGY